MKTENVGRWWGWGVAAAALALVVAMSLSAAARGGSRVSGKVRPVAAAGPRGSEVTPGIARAEKDTLDLQLD